MSALLDRLLMPMNEYLNDPGVTDIVANKPQRLFVRKGGIWRPIDVPEYDFDTMDAMTILIGARAGKDFDEGHPYLNASMPGGQRFQGVRPAGTIPGQFLWAIRRPPTSARRLEDPDIEEMTEETNRVAPRQALAAGEVGQHYKNRAWRDCFYAARMAGMSMAFCGGTGGGKTDMARRMIQVYRPNIRIVTIESDAEYGEAGPENKAPLLYDEQVVTSDEAVRIAKRLAPDEIFLQEVRGAEAYPLLQALESGHPGCTSWHARPGKELESLAMMVRQHPSGRVMEEGRLMQMLSDAFDMLVFCERDDSRPGKFRIANVRLMAEELEFVA